MVLPLASFLLPLVLLFLVWVRCLLSGSFTANPLFISRAFDNSGNTLLMVMKKRNFLFTIGVSVFMAVSFLWVPPVQAFTSLQSCYQSPQCAKMLADAGMIGSSTVPQGVVTTPVAANAIASGAPAASTIALPQVLADGAAVAGGIASLVFPWGQDKADQLGSLYSPPYEGGQCPGTAYGWRVNWIEGGQPKSTSGAAGDGPLNPGLSASVAKVANPNGAQFGDVWQITSSWGQLLRQSSQQITNVDFSVYKLFAWQPDDCGSPPPLKSPDELPSPQEFEDIFGTPQQVPWPDSTPGPDGIPGNEDDEYPGVFLPGPLVAPDSAGKPAYYPAGLDVPNPEGSSGNGGSGGDPGSDPQPVDINLNPAPSQSSGCFGWGYAICQLDDNFPFDVLGDLPTATAPPCPSFTFFGQTAEFCFVTDLLGYVKWIVGVIMTVRALMEL